MSKNMTTFEEMSRIIKNNRERRRGAIPSKPQNCNFYGNCDSPGTMGNGAATFFWVVAMVISALFKHGWALCILETIVWWKFITRHK